MAQSRTPNERIVRVPRRLQEDLCGLFQSGAYAAFTQDLDDLVAAPQNGSWLKQGKAQRAARSTRRNWSDPAAGGQVLAGNGCERRQCPPGWSLAQKVRPRRRICCDMGCPALRLILAAKWHCRRRQIGNGAGSPRAVCSLHEVPSSLG